jgi:hypothetical protein
VRVYLPDDASALVELVSLADAQGRCRMSAALDLALAVLDGMHGDSSDPHPASVNLLVRQNRDTETFGTLSA